MSIAGYDVECVGSQVEVDAVHHWTQLVVSGSEDGARDVVDENGSIDGYRVGSIVNSLCVRIFLCALCSEVVETVLVRNLDGESIVGIDVEAKWLLRQFLQSIEDDAVRDAELALALVLCEFDTRLDDVVAIAGCDSHLTIGNLE